MTGDGEKVSQLHIFRNERKYLSACEGAAVSFFSAILPKMYLAYGLRSTEFANSKNWSTGKKIWNEYVYVAVRSITRISLNDGNRIHSYRCRYFFYSWSPRAPQSRGRDRLPFTRWTFSKLRFYVRNNRRRCPAKANKTIRWFYDCLNIIYTHVMMTKASCRCSNFQNLHNRGFTLLFEEILVNVHLLRAKQC